MTQARELLVQTVAEFAKALDGLTDAQLRFQPAPLAWWILACAEHVARVERLIAEQVLGKALQSPAGPSRREAPFHSETIPQD